MVLSKEIMETPKEGEKKKEPFFLHILMYHAGRRKPGQNMSFSSDMQPDEGQPDDGLQLLMETGQAE